MSVRKKGITTKVNSKGNVTVITIDVGEVFSSRIAGEITTEMHREIKKIIERIDREQEKKSVKKLILDLKNIEFIDSSGLGSFIALEVIMLKRKGKLVLRNVDNNVLELLKIAGLDRFLQIEGKRKLAKSIAVNQSSKKISQKSDKKSFVETSNKEEKTKKRKKQKQPQPLILQIIIFFDDALS